ncbi:DUF4861 domain-containing protein [Maribacter polysiphoniae]|uniref:DUF4861 domain-containing protein n=1 Tax=Maribacter polysiphoniae TaxID=429344 RepID=A0A316E8V2_9FLAO|nr:DUF4861 domain-containing protein [Maribacter polysiphoniae]MBD1262397.1 DUF4861 domain-containing protein [Maribacter polysiphoniae]PWK26098.1 uncharacterized protein DUF4861 [Maribacter polysiphoniae]
MNKLYALFCVATLLLSCGEGAQSNKKIVVKNTMDFDRAFETVSIPISALELDSSENNIVIKDVSTGKNLVSQKVDSNGDGVLDEVLFQPEIKANAEKTFEVVVSDELDTVKTDADPACYSRFVPERTDDYAWENNRVAFRTYGPTAQQLAEEGDNGGTLSSGIDAWLKRVDYPIINKWYEKDLSGSGSYHKDTGEGLDNFHVGVSRGVGGIAKKVDSTYYISKNFTTWKTLSTGPIRTSFVLAYADWDAAGNKISEEKRISLDYGSNLSRFEVTLKGTDTISAGLTLHEKTGETEVNTNNGWISYWEPLQDSELGMGIVVPEGKMVGYEKYLTERNDESNLFVHIKTENNKAVYYTGFGWKKSGQFNTKADWDAYLNRFSQCLKNPLVFEVQ